MMLKVLMVANLFL